MGLNVQSNHYWNQKYYLWYGVCFVLIIASYFILRLNLIDIPLSRDEGGFAYFGRLAAEGGTLYRDGFDHKPPGVWYIYAALSKIVPFTASGLHWMIHIYNFSVLICIIYLTWRMFNIRASLWTALVYSMISSTSYVEGFSATAEMLMLLPIVLSVLSGVVGAEQRKPIYVLFSGFSGGIAFWIKQPALAIMVFMIGWFCIEFNGQKKIRQLSLYVSLFVTGFLSISIVLLLSFWMNSTWDEFIYWSFTHSISYAISGTITYAFRMLTKQLLMIFYNMPFLWILIGIFYVMKGTKTLKTNYFLIGFLVFSFLTAAHSPQMYPHYFALVCPALAINAGVAMSTFIDRQKRLYIKTALISAGLIGLFILPILMNINYYFFNTPEENSIDHFNQTIFTESAQIAEYLKNNTRESDKILILGSEPQILVLANRQSATRHLFMYQVVGSFERSAEFQEQVINDLKKNKPPYVVSILERYSWLGSDNHKVFLQKLIRIMASDYKIEGAVVRKNNKSRLITGHEYKKFINAQKTSNARISAFLFKRNTSF